MVSEFKAFVSNIPYNCTEEEFKTFMMSQDTTNTITGVKLIQSQKRNEQVSTKNKGFGFITFNDESVRNSFMSNDQIMFDGRRLKFTEYTNQQKYYKLHVSNLPESLSINELTDVFSRYGMLDSVKKDYNFQTQTFKGTGEVVYTNYEDFHKVLTMKDIPFVEGITFTAAKRYKPVFRKFQPRQTFVHGFQQYPPKRLTIVKPSQE